jgi:hypothetical protein
VVAEEWTGRVRNCCPREVGTPNIETKRKTLILQLGQRKLNIHVENVVTEIAYNYTFYEEKTNFFM